MTTFPQEQIPPVPQRKPSGGVVALGVINIVYSSLFYLCCGLVSIASPFYMSAFQQLAEKQGVTGYHPSPELQIFSVISGFVTIVLGVLLLIGGIGLLRLRLWGRALSMGASAAIIVWVLIVFIINVFFVYPHVSGMMGNQFPQGQQMVLSVMAGIFGVFFQLVYPVILLICLNLSSVKAQFESAR